MVNMHAASGRAVLSRREGDAAPSRMPCRRSPWGVALHAVCLTGLAAAALMGAAAMAPARAQQAPSMPSGGLAQAPETRQVVAAGIVPDEATRVAVIARLRELYGADRVVDQLTLGPVVAPPQWARYVQRLLSASIRQVSHGQLRIQGNTVDIRGEVGNEATRQQVASDMASSLNPTYTVRDGLRVAVREQAMVDQALADRVIEFEPGSAVLRPAALPILDEMAEAMTRLRGRRVEVIGHTDAVGPRQGNVSLSLARAQAVKDHLVGKGLPAEGIATSGMGPDRPVAPNDTDEGRARNRRIEFRVGG